MSHEMLIVDPSRADREAIGGYFRGQGFLVTDSGDAREAQALVTERFYPVVLVDADIEPWGGLEFVSFVKAESPRSEVILLTSRRSYDVAVGGYRRGAADVVFKDPAEAQRLREQVDRAVRRAEARASNEASAPAEMRALMDEMLRRLVDLTQRDPAMRSRLAAIPSTRVRVAVVDHEAPVHEAVRAAAAAGDGTAWAFDATHMPSGGAALDALTASPPDVLLVRDDLMDLQGSVLLGALATTDVVAILYRPAAGEATVLEKGRPERLVKPIASPADLVRELPALCERAAASAAERRVMDLFRMEHADLVRRYASLRTRLDEAARFEAGE